MNFVLTNIEVFVVIVLLNKPKGTNTENYLRKFKGPHRPVSQLIWAPVDLDPRSISTSPGPNLLVDMDPRGSKSTSKFGPPLADLDPLQKLNICNVNTII